MKVPVKRRAEREHLARIAKLEERIATQSRVIQAAARDASRSHVAAAAAFQLAAAAEFLVQSDMLASARHVFSALQFLESEYQSKATTPNGGADR